MISKVRGKFFVLGIEKQQGFNGRTIKLGAVSASDKEQSENNIYHKYTPSADIRMFVDNPEAEEFFALGETMYVDFVKAPKE